MKTVAEAAGAATSSSGPDLVRRPLLDASHFTRIYEPFAGLLLGPSFRRVPHPSCIYVGRIRESRRDFRRAALVRDN